MIAQHLNNPFHRIQVSVHANLKKCHAARTQSLQLIPAPSVTKNPRSNAADFGLIRVLMSIRGGH
jgi:hypothetical protein